MHENEFQSLRQFEESSKFSRRGSSGVFARNGVLAACQTRAQVPRHDDQRMMISSCESQIDPATQLPAIAAFAEFLCDLLVKRSGLLGTPVSRLPAHTL